MPNPYRTAGYYRRKAEKKIASILTGNETPDECGKLLEEYRKKKEESEEAYEMARAEHEALCNRLVPF